LKYPHNTTMKIVTVFGKGIRIIISYVWYMNI
jgi:hypothetical protein